MAVVEATVGAEVGLGVLPIENSLHGPVAETHDLLYEAPLSIVSEVTLPIVHCLSAKTILRLDEVRTLRSHPVAFDQCRDLIRALGVTCIPSATTADAAREVAESDGSVPRRRSRAARPRGALRAARDRRGRRRPADAFTRFVGIAAYTRLERAAALADGALVRHRPSAGLALPRARAVPPARAEPRAARLAADPALDLPLPLRHGARRPSAGRRDPEGAGRDARVDARDAHLRQLPCDGGP